VQFYLPSVELIIRYLNNFKCSLIIKDITGFDKITKQQLQR